MNELYAEGVHQSAASFELGDPTLTREQAYNTSATLAYASEKVDGEVGGYINYIQNYLYLAPAFRYIHTVRGAYPVFNYTQANALFKGLDARVSYRPVPRLTTTTALSLLWAYNESANDYLIYAPPNRWQNSLRLALGPTPSAAYVGLNNTFVARQSRVPVSGDYAPPPAAYDLWGTEAGTTLRLGRQPFELSLTVTNLLNRDYRDYLNRFRYYTADLGTNVQARVRIPLVF